MSFGQYTDWVERGHFTPLNYLADHRKDLRENLQSVMPSFQQALVMAFSYRPAKKRLKALEQDSDWNGWKIASYALGFEGEDYHEFLSKRLQKIGSELKERLPDLNYQLCLDVHPVLERDLAYRAGLGWFGKNSMLISPAEGSFFILGSLLLDRPIIAEQAKPLETDHCGTCTACLDICPTDAILAGERKIVAERCISTFTIELFKDAPAIEGHVERGSGEIFGCDLCQDICPWNRKPLERTPGPLNEEPWWLSYFLRRPRKDVISEVEQLSERAYRRQFKGTVFERLGRKGMLKNLKLLRGEGP